MKLLPAIGDAIKTNAQPFIQPFQDVYNATKENAASGDIPSQYVNNNYVKPVEKALSSTSSPVDRVVGGTQAVLNSLYPGATATNAGLNSGKNAYLYARTGKNPVEGATRGLTGQEMPAIGTAVTNNQTAAKALNAGEFFMPFAGGLKGKGEALNFVGNSMKAEPLYQDDINHVSQTLQKLGNNKVDVNEYGTLQKTADAFNNGYNLMNEGEWQRLDLHDKYKMIAQKMNDVYETYYKKGQSLQ